MNFKKKYNVDNNILEFNSEDPTFKSVSKFYDIEPFPSYKKNDNKLSILSVGEKNKFLKQLKNKIGYQKTILEAGSGTCQLISYLAIGTNNQCFALDSSKNALEMGSEFAKKNNIINITYCRGDILDEIFENKSFDYIWCSGVLHHTKNAEKGFDQLVKYLKDDGLIIVGLYNRYGRFWTNLRRYLYNIFGPKIIYNFDPVVKKLVKKNQLDQKKINSWIRDQYKHPLEKTYTFDHILSWFKKNNIQFINSIPQCDFSESNDDLFLQKSEGNFISRFIRQILMIFQNYGSEGGLFLFIGKKKVNSKLK